ncbi:MAG: hypothetical protein ACLGJB_12215 [Blastocatellia bacterium]
MKRSLTLMFFTLIAVAFTLGSQRPSVTLSQDPESALQRLIAIQDRNEAAILSRPEIRGFGIGREGDQLVFHIYVAEEVQTPIRIPAQIEGVPARRIPIGPLRALSSMMGTSTSNGNGCSAGTLGLRVVDATNPAVSGYVTNNHVAAVGGASLCANGAASGAKQYAPGLLDNNCKVSTEVGKLNRFVPINFSPTVFNTVDAAFVENSGSGTGDSTACGLCFPSTNVVSAVPGMPVRKCGRTTNLTSGTIATVNFTTAAISYGSGCGSARFKKQIVVTGSSPFSDKGDSGSAVYTTNGIVGLLFAGDPAGTTIVNPIADVFSALKVTPGLGSSCTPGAPGSDSAYGGPGSDRLPRVYISFSLTSPETLVAIGGGTLLKFELFGGSGQNLFALQNSGGTWSSLPCYKYLIGVQKFPAEVRDVDFIGGYTFVALADGRVLKINGTGGTGQNMFAINVAPGGFTGIPGYSYYVGSHKFPVGIADVSQIGSEMLISFDDGRMLKVAGTGGTGFNLFGIKDNGGSYSGLAGYPYYVGDQALGSGVTAVANVSTGTMIATANGKVLKIYGSGGTGHNMYGVTPTSGGYNPVSGYNYYIGDQKFIAPVNQILETGSELLAALGDGRMLKIAGTGGTGHNMFAVKDNGSSFTGVAGYNYYVGDQKLSAPATAMAFINGKLMIGFANGKILKVNGTGGTGHNMLAVQETANGFATLAGYNYLIGSTNLGAPISQILFPGSYLWIGVGNGKLLRINGVGGTGFNMFAVAQNPADFTGLCGYSYFLGSQGFK